MTWIGLIEEKTKSLIARWHLYFALGFCVLITVAVIALSESDHRRLKAGYANVIEIGQVSLMLNELMANMIDAETAQRGYLLTQKNEYLQPYQEVTPRVQTLLTQINAAFLHMRDDEGRQQFIDISELVGATLSEIQLTVNFAQNGRMETAREIFESDAGKKTMDQLRVKVSMLEQREHEHTVQIIKSWDSTLSLSRFDIALLSFINILLFVALFRWLDAQQRKEYAERNLMRTRHGELNTLIRQRTLQLENLASTLQQVSEVEKSRLARELHDELGAILTATRMDVLWVRQHLSPEQQALSEKLMQAMANLEQGIHIKRRIIEDLRPTILVTLGFVTAARELAEQAAARAGWELNLNLPDEIPPLREDMSIALFRILQESLTNAAKYTRATRVTIDLTCKEGLIRLEIRDNGVGFRQQDLTMPTHGLLGMRQRVVAFGGRFEITSSPGKGTWVQVGVLLDGGAPAGDAVLTTELLSL